MGKCIAWTEDEEKTLRAKAGKIPPKRIASSMGRTLSSVLSRAQALGITLRTKTVSWQGENLLRLAELRQEGMSWEDIGKEFNLPGSTCKQAFYRNMDLLKEAKREKLLASIRLELEEVLRVRELKKVMEILEKADFDSLTQYLARSARV